MAESVPANRSFETDDAEDEWTWSTRLDYIHDRAVLSCVDNPSRVIEKAFGALAPGGHLEYQDGVFPMGVHGRPARGQQASVLRIQVEPAPDGVLG